MRRSDELPLGILASFSNDQVVREQLLDFLPDFERTRRRMVGNLVNDFFFGPKIGTRPNGVPIYKMNMSRWLRPLTPAEYASISTTARYEAESGKISGMQNMVSGVGDAFGQLAMLYGLGGFGKSGLAGITGNN